MARKAPTMSKGVTQRGDVRTTFTPTFSKMRGKGRKGSARMTSRVRSGR